MTSLSIAGRLISSDSPVFVIAEIGVNHDGSVDRAIELVRYAAVAGADAVKLQIFQARNLMHPSGTFANYQSQKQLFSDPVAMLRRYELSPDDLRRIVTAIRDRGMIPLATPFSLSDISLLSELDFPAVKIASPDIINWPLLRKCASFHWPMIVSTGAATIDEIVTAATWLRDWDARFAFLHCVSSYPTAEQDANLCWISELAERFQVPIGYSDHTTDELAGAFAAAAGACIVEKHLTYDRCAPGPDHSASADPEQFACYVAAIRSAWRLRGRPGKTVLACERDVRQVSRQSLVSIRALPAGHLIEETDLTTQRPGNGILASFFLQVVGRTTLRPIPAGTMLDWTMLSLDAKSPAAC